MTIYSSIFPIDSIPPVDPLDHDLLRQRQVYQSIAGWINFLTTCTCPDIAPALTFLASYGNAPHPQHYKYAVHALKYLTSTNVYVILFHSKSASTLQALNYFPHQHDKEAYTEETAPSPSEFHKITAVCNACWGVQFGSEVERYSSWTIQNPLSI